MSTRKTGRGRQKAEIPQGEQRILPPLPPRPTPKPTAEDLAKKAELSRKLHELYIEVTRQNLTRVLRLVQLALAGHAPKELVDHFSLIGRDYYKLADNGPPKPNLRVIEGGAD